MSLVVVDLPYGHGSRSVTLPASRLLGQFSLEQSLRAISQGRLKAPRHAIAYVMLQTGERMGRIWRSPSAPLSNQRRL
jgi:hypothetical protein